MKVDRFLPLIILITSIIWLIFVLPLFVLGLGFGDLGVGDELGRVFIDAANGDLISLAMLLLTLSLTGLPWALRILFR